MDFTLRVTVTLTFDLLTLKSIGFFYSIRAITLWSLKALGQRVLELLSGNGFQSSGHCDLDLWPTDPKINRALLLNKGYHPAKFEGSGSKGTRVIERKRSVTDGQTDRRTRQKQYVSPRGGRHNERWQWRKNDAIILVASVACTKFGVNRPKQTQVIERTLNFYF